MKRTRILVLAAAIMSAPIALPRITSGASDDHFDLALRWAPKFYCDIHADNLRADVPTDIHFDRDVDIYPTGDGVITDNWDNLDLVAPSARVYYAVVETETHFYISYFLYHPRDWESLDKKRERVEKDWPFGIEHEHDLEGITLVITNPGDEFEVAYTQAHGDTYYFSDGSPAVPNCVEPLEGYPVSSWDHRDGGYGNGQTMFEDASMHFEGARPLVFVEREGHGIGQIRRALEPDGSGPYMVSGANYRFYNSDGIVLVPALDGVSAEVPTVANAEYAYGLMSFADEFWANNTNGAWFSESYPTLTTMRGVVFTGLGGAFAVGAGHNIGASPPWTWQELYGCPGVLEWCELDNVCAGGASRGDWFLDPAQFVSSHITELAGISLNYVDNEFLAGDNSIVVETPSTWTSGSSATIRWDEREASYPQSGISDTCFAQLLAADGSVVWTRSQITTSNESQNITVPSVPAGTYRLRIHAWSENGDFLPIDGYSFSFEIVAGEDQFLPPCSLAELGANVLSRTVDASTGYCFVGDGTRLRVIDVSDANLPRAVGNVGIWDLNPGGTPSELWGLARSDDLIYMACSFSGLQIVDVATPEAPTVVGAVLTPGIALGVAVAGSYAYVADNFGLQIVDVTNRGNPVIVGSVDGMNSASCVAVAGQRWSRLSG